MTDDAPSLIGRHLVRTFGDGDTQTTAVDDVSLELYRGQFALLMGPSGSGKSTLLAVLSGLLHPTAGDVVAREDDDVLDLWQLSDKAREEFRLRHCGYIFQGYNLFPALTARQQLEIVLRWGMNVGPREARRQSDEMLAILGLGKKGHLLPSASVRRRKAAGGDRPGAGQEPEPGVRRRADQCPRLVTRRAGGGTVAGGCPRARRDAAVRLARRPHRALRGHGVPPGRRPADGKRPRGARLADGWAVMLSTEYYVLEVLKRRWSHEYGERTESRAPNIPPRD